MTGPREAAEALYKAHTSPFVQLCLVLVAEAEFGPRGGERGACTTEADRWRRLAGSQGPRARSTVCQHTLCSRADPAPGATLRAHPWAGTDCEPDPLPYS